MLSFKVYFNIRTFLALVLIKFLLRLLLVILLYEIFLIKKELNVYIFFFRFYFKGVMLFFIVYKSNKVIIKNFYLKLMCVFTIYVLDFYFEIIKVV